MKKDKELKTPLSVPDPQRSASAKASWTPERRKKFSEYQKKVRANASGNRSKGAKTDKGGEEATVLGVLTFLRFAAQDVVRDIRKEEVTIRTIRRKDVLTLLAYVDLRDSR